MKKLSKEDIAARLQDAREACGLTQERVADELGVQRATVSHMESGRRQVTSLELAKLAYLYGREVGWFLRTSGGAAGEGLGESSDDDSGLAILYRATPEIMADDETAAELRQCISVAREMRNLERILGVADDGRVRAAYDLPAPASKWEAIQQGVQVSEAERRRLDVGDGPIYDMTELLETQGVVVVKRRLPQDFSGATIRESTLGTVIIVNSEHSLVRRRFSYAHEYAHAIMDRGHTDRGGIVSRASDREELIEVRANSFAASFLLPEPAVHRFAASVGKGLPSRASADVYDEDAVVRGNKRPSPGSQGIQIYEVVYLADWFGVSMHTTLYRMKNARPALVDETEFAWLKEMVDSGTPEVVRKIFDMPQPQDEERGEREMWGRFLSLGLEAYRREEISRGKLTELARLSGVPIRSLMKLTEV